MMKLIVIPIERAVRMLCLAIFAVFVSLSALPASAQLSIEIGLSRDKAVRTMVNLGYTQIKILKKGFKTLEATACQNGTRFKVKMNSRYRAKNTQNLGPCRRTVTAQSIENNLTNSGFTRIVIDQQNGNFVALACRNEDRVRIVFSRQGEVLQRRKIGRCEEIFQPNDVRQVLRQAGYNRIKFIDRQLPWYRAEACLDGKRLELLLTRYGDVRRTKRIGDCAPPLNPRRIAGFLQDKGYSQVEVLDDRLPTYAASGCLDNDRIELEMNRYGAVTKRTVIGVCRQEMNERDIVELLESEGFTRVNVRRRGNGNFEISSCLEGYEKFATLSPFGELISERDGKRCASRDVSEIFNRLNDRGFSDIRFSSEGCRRGKRIRIYYDNNGDRIGRENLGSC
ncbi:MAG: hypothetical protein AAF478_03835 [Pseudomonadota bacterium]